MQKQMNKWTSRAQAVAMSLVLTVILVLAQGMEVRGQEQRVFDINNLKELAKDPVQESEPMILTTQETSDTRARIAQLPVEETRRGPLLTHNRVADFQNLYFNTQPAIYFNADGPNDATKGSPVTTVYVKPNQLNQLRGVALNTAKLLVIEGGTLNGLATLLADDSVLPELEFLLIKSEAGSSDLNAQRVNTSLGLRVFENRPDLIVIYNNLDLAQ